MHIIKRKNTFYSFVNVPLDLQPIIGKTRLMRSTKTGDKRLATQRAAAIVLNWKAEFSRLRNTAPDPFIAEAIELSKNTAPSWLMRSVLTDKIIPALADTKTAEAVGAFEQIATGGTVALVTLLDKFRENELSRGMKPRTVDQALTDVDLLLQSLPTIDFLTPERVLVSIRSMGEQNEMTASSVTRIVRGGRAFWRFLQTEAIVPEHVANPFVVPAAFKRSRKTSVKTKNRTIPWQAFTAADIERIYSAISTDDQNLRNLLKIGAFTGCRIEEVASLKIEDVDLNAESLRIVDAKTQAGNRTIPIHSAIQGLVGELVSGSPDGYLLPGINPDKYGGRSNALSMRFGRVKRALGYGESHVFHSVRKFFVTTLENAGVTENVAASIVGHDKSASMTFGLYSAGIGLDVMRPAVESVVLDI